MKNETMTDAQALAEIDLARSDAINADCPEQAERLRRSMVYIATRFRGGSAQSDQQSVAWRSPDDLPDVARGEYSHFWVAIRRNGLVASYPAVYLNSMPLDRDDCEPIEHPESGNRWRNDPPGEDDECCMLATGWHDSREHSEYDGYYSHLLEEGAELLGWREVARWPADDHSPDAGKMVGAEREVG